jgi:hypothetical protein
MARSDFGPPAVRTHRRLEEECRQDCGNVSLDRVTDGGAKLRDRTTIYGVCQPVDLSKRETSEQR